MADEDSSTPEQQEPKVRRKRAGNDAVVLPRPPAYKPKPDVFFKYWASLFPKFEERVTATIYRNWPVLDRVRNGKTKYIDKVSRAMGRDDLLHNYGSGDYTIYLNDAGNAGKTLCQANLVDRFALRDPDHPPLVPIEDVVMDDPANGSFLENLRARGMLPADPKENEDVAANDAVKTMADTIGSLTTKVIEGKQNNSGTEAQATKVAFEMIKETSSMANRMLENATAKATEIAGKSNDGHAVIEQVIGLVERLQPKQAPDSGLAAILPFIQMTLEKGEHANAQILAMQADRLKFTEELIVNLKGAKPRSILEDLEQLKALRDSFRDMFGPEPAAKAQDDTWAQVLPVIAPALSTALAAGANLFYNYIASKTNTPPIPPPPVPAPPPAIAPQSPPAAAATTPESQPQPQEQDHMLSYIRFVRQIEEPLLTSLRSDATGADFAQWMIREHGRQVFDQLRHATVSTVESLLQLHPPLWSALQQEPRWTHFFAEFLSFDPDAPTVIRRKPQQQQPPHTAA